MPILVLRTRARTGPLVRRRPRPSGSGRPPPDRPPADVAWRHDDERGRLRRALAPGSSRVSAAPATPSRNRVDPFGESSPPRAGDPGRATGAACTTAPAPGTSDVIQGGRAAPLDHVRARVLGATPRPAVGPAALHAALLPRRGARPVGRPSSVRRVPPRGLRPLPRPRVGRARHEPPGRRRARPAAPRRAVGPAPTHPAAARLRLGRRARRRLRAARVGSCRRGRRRAAALAGRQHVCRVAGRAAPRRRGRR